jgi:hypothetical protein
MERLWHTEVQTANKMYKINQVELPEIIAQEIPEIKSEIGRLSSKENIAATLQVVVTYTREMLTRHQVAKVNYCMALMGWIYNLGNEPIRDLIENLFVRSFNGMRSLCRPNEWDQIQSRMPAKLYMVYKGQNSFYNK